MSEWIVASPFATGSTVANAIHPSVIVEHGIATGSTRGSCRSPAPTAPS
jgi:hypothetical protein